MLFQVHFKTILKKLINKWIKNILKKHKLENICLAGGVAMNVKNNLKISEKDK